MFVRVLRLPTSDLVHPQPAERHDPETATEAGIGFIQGASGRVFRLGRIHPGRPTLHQRLGPDAGLEVARRRVHREGHTGQHDEGDGA